MTHIHTHKAISTIMIPNISITSRSFLVSLTFLPHPTFQAATGLPSVAISFCIYFKVELTGLADGWVWAVREREGWLRDFSLRTGRLEFPSFGIRVEQSCGRAQLWTCVRAARWSPYGRGSVAVGCRSLKFQRVWARDMRGRTESQGLARAPRSEWR